MKGKMKKIIKNLFAVSMAMALTLTPVLTVQTAAATSEAGVLSTNGKIVTNTAKVAISNDNLKLPLDTNGSPDITFTTYQILYATYESDNNSLEYHLTNWAKAALVGDSKKFETESAAIEALIAITSSNNAEILNELAKNAGSNTYSANWGWASDSASFSASLPVGAYLVTAKASSMTFMNMMVSVDVSATSGTAVSEWKLKANDSVLKGEGLTVTKKISEENTLKDTDSVAVGDTVNYTVTATVPKFPANAANHVFKVTDTPKNLEIDLDSVKVKAGSDILDKYTENNINYDYKVTKTNDTGTLTVDFTEKYFSTFYHDSSYPYSSVIITYQAKVLSSAVVKGEDGDNKNTVKLTYGNSPYDTASTGTDEDTAEVFTYGVKLTKYESSEDVPQNTLSNAVFQISKIDQRSAIEFVKESSGNYRVYDSSTDLTPTPAATTQLTTGTDGTLTLYGLDEGRYSLSEVKAPSGYAINTNTLTFTIADKKDAQNNLTGVIDPNKLSIKEMSGDTEIDDAHKTWTCAVMTKSEDNVSTGYLSVTLTDTKLPALPATGGRGIIVITIVGVLLMIGAIMLVFGAKNSKGEEA